MCLPLLCAALYLFNFRTQCANSLKSIYAETGFHANMGISFIFKFFVSCTNDFTGYSSISEDKRASSACKLNPLLFYSSF